MSVSGARNPAVDPAGAGLSTAVILARGLGTRMRRDAAAAALRPDQVAAADHGVKAMMPIGAERTHSGARPFLDHVLSELADAGITDACLVIGPGHQAVRDYYGRLETRRIRVGYAIQDEPRGTADAVLAAESYVAGRRFLTVNGDNFYAASTVQALAGVPGNALAGYVREALVARGNIPADRIAAFALIEADAGVLVDLVEKPPASVVAAAGPRALVSMNCFAFTPAIFAACKAIGPSARGEYEITDAVRHLVASGEAVRVVPVEDGVLDLSSRGDIASVEAALRDRPVNL